MIFRPTVTIFFALCSLFCLLSGIGAGPAFARDWHVPAQAPTIQAAVDSSVSGDVVVIAPGTYDDCTHLNGNNVKHIAILQPGISLRGETGDPTDVILDAGNQGRCLEMRNVTGDVSIEGLTFLRGRAVNPFGSGGGVFVFSSEPSFANCVFDSCSAQYGGGGINVSYGGLTLDSCVFLNNSTDNIGAAVRVTRSPATLTSCTFYGSSGESIHYATDDLTLDRCLIVGGDAEAIVRNQTTDPDPTLTCCNIYGNDEDWASFFSDQLDQDGNLSLDPLFCNPLFGDLHLYAVSMCAPEHNPECGLIGALPVGCGSGASTIVVQPNGLGDQPTLQAAMNVAADGDTILLADGVFTGDGNRDLDTLGKALTIRGMSVDAALAIIDCQGSGADPHRGFYFHQDETTTTTLEYVTIINADVAEDGAAILCESSPLIRHCVFESNHAERGAAVFCRGGDPRIENCLFRANEGRQKAGGIGFLASEAEVTDCIFTGNWGYQGSALFLPDSSQVMVEGCTLAGNNSSLDKACVATDGNSRLTLRNSIISDSNRRAVRRYGQSSITLNTCDIYNNAEGDYTGYIEDMEGQNGNISGDPLYCDPAGETFTVRGDSPCASYNAANDARIGAAGVACQAPVHFTDISATLPVGDSPSGGVAWIYANDDDHLDAFVANNNTANEMLLGDGAGGFNHLGDTLAQYAGPTVAGVWADYDNNGTYDVYMVNDQHPNLLFTNQSGIFSDVANDGIAHLGPAAGSNWIDFDNDGKLDLFIAAEDSTSLLMRNDGDGGFTDATLSPLTEIGKVVTSVWGDYDNDGDRDLYIVHDGQDNQLYDNGDTFSESTPAVLEIDGAGRGAAWGDYDNDGYLDLYLVNDGQANQLFRNNGSGGFEDKTSGALGDDGPGRSGVWGDWDNDGDLDLFLTNCGAADRLLRNDGQGLFVDVADSNFAAPDSSTGAAFGDYDADGDLDLLLADQQGSTRIIRNDHETQHHWLRLNLTSAAGQVGCLGARVRLVTRDSLVQIREPGAAGGWLSQNDPLVHFGLGTATVVDTIQISWPDGTESVLFDQTVDQILAVDGSGAVAVPDAGVPVGALVCRLSPGHPNPFNPATKFSFIVPQSGPVSLKVYDVRGRLVTVLLDQVLDAGGHQITWRGEDRAGRPAAAGVYYCRLQAGQHQRTRAVTLLK